MTNSKSTKRALFSSILALVLCFAMLLGTTFAWFTDTAKTSVNKIQAGTLDVALEMYEDGEWVNAEGKTLNFLKAAEHEEEAVLWEPGCTYELQPVKIVNKGNLALKYKVVITAKSVGDKDLAEVLTVTLKDGNNEAENCGNLSTLLKDGIAKEYHLAANASSNELTIALHMLETAGNEYQNASIENIAITVYATQDTVEFDSTTNEYDKDAEFEEPGWDGTVASEEELAQVTNTEEKTVKIDSPELLAAFAVSVNNGNNYKDYKVTLEEDINLGNQDWTPIGNSVFDSSGANVISGYFCGNFDGQGHTISNLKVNGGAENPIDTDACYQGLFGCLNAQGNMVYIQNLTIHNADIYAKNGAGAFVGNMFTYQHLGQSGQSNIWNCKLTGKVTIKGGNSGGIAGAYTEKWAILTSYQNIVIDVEEGSYVTNVGVEGGAGQIGGVAAVAAYSSGTENITTNLDVIAKEGTVGGAFGVVGGKFKDITCTGDVIVKNVDADTSDFKNYASVLGLYVPVSWNRTYIKDDTLSATGKFEIQLTNGTVVTSNGQTTNLVGGRAW